MKHAQSSPPSPERSASAVENAGPDSALRSSEASPRLGATTDIQDRNWAEALLVGENRVLEMIARGTPLAPILDAVCRLVEQLSSGCLCSILLLDPDGNRLQHGAAPGLPASYTQAIDGRAIGPSAGSCGTAAYRREPVIVADIATDPLWADYRALALTHELRACWSTPIFSPEGNVLGTFAIYSREPRSPTPQHHTIIKQMTHLAAIAIERKRTETALQESEERFRRMADTILEVIWFTALEPERVVYVSPSFERIWGLPVADLYRNPRLWMETIHPEDRERVTDTFARWRAGEKVNYHDVEYRIVQPDGSTRWIHERGVLTLNEQGKAYLASGISTDITERKLAEEAVRSARARFEGILKIAEDAIISIDSHQRITLFNQGAEKVFGYTASEAIGNPLDLLIPQRFGDVHRKHVDEFALSPDAARPMGQRREVFGRRKDGHEFPAEASISKLDLGGELVFTVILRDVTERKRAVEDLRRSEAYLAEAQRLSRTGSFGWNSSSGELVWSEETFCILGYDEATKPSVELVFNRVHPEDRALVQQNLDRASRDGTDLDFEHRLLMPDSSVKHVHVTAHVVRDEFDALEFVGAVSDITTVRTAEERIRQDEREFRQIVEAIPALILVLAPDGSPLYANERVLEYTGLTLDDVYTGGFRERAFHPADVERLRGERQQALARGIPFELEQRVRRKDGQYRWFLTHFNPLRDDQGRILRWYATGTDIDGRRRAEERTQNENLALREEVDKTSMFEEIVGASPILRAVLARVAKVAPTDSTVLITGETGTGKELVARAIHKQSLRASGAFVSVNCAAVPPALIASELFGHEKGAFTGALQRRLGRFELAEGGTLFLDEVGELPAETQIALLRVLQEHEFERVGGAQAIRADVRVIAAANRDLQAAIAAGAFRNDLFYRLNVFPIEMPPLRDRPEDIPLLVEYFIDRYARKAGKIIRGVNKKTLELLQVYSWPGNIRELQNVIERSVIVCETETFSVDQSWLLREARPLQPENQTLSRRPVTLEKDAIEAALAETRGRVSGPAGAAAKLGLPPSTLESKIRSLKINKHRFKPV
jgi:formate hydrogenlyase transcriptional activator